MAFSKGKLTLFASPKILGAKIGVIHKIEYLKSEISKLREECQEKDNIIAKKENETAEFTESMNALRNELKSNINELNEKKLEFDKELIEIKKMKMIFNEELFRGKWNIVKFLVK